MKNKKRKYLMSLAVLFALLAVTFFEFRDKLPDILASLSMIPARQVALIICAGLGYQLLDAAMCMTLVRSRLPGLSYAQGFELTMAGVFCMVCTNSLATIPLQSLYLHKYSLDVGHTVGLVTLKYVFHKAAIFLIALLLLLLNFSWLRGNVPDALKYILPGFVLCFLIIVFLLLLCTWDALRLLLFRLLDSLPDKGFFAGKKDGWRESIRLMYTEMQNLRTQKKRLAAVMGLNFLKLALVYAIPYMCLSALGFTRLDPVRAELLGALVWLLAGVLPSVSGLGPTEVAFAMLFGAVAPEGISAAALLLYRAATYFAPFVVSLPTVFIAQHRLGLAEGPENGGEKDAKTKRMEKNPT